MFVRVHAAIKHCVYKSVNVTYNNKTFTTRIIKDMENKEKPIHPTLERLMLAAQELRGITSFAQLARVLDETDQTINNWKNRGISSKGLVKAQKHIGCSATWLSTGEGAMQAQSADTPPALSPGSNIIAFAPGDELPEDFVLVPVYRVEFAAGAGQAAYDFVEEGDPVAYRVTWLRHIGVNHKHVKRVTVSGDSMEPLLYDGDSVLIDISDNDPERIIDGKVYAIRYGQDLRIKRLSRRLDGTLILRSENKAYEPEEIPPTIAAENITILGRVRDRSGAGGL